MPLDHESLLAPVAASDKTSEVSFAQLEALAQSKKWDDVFEKSFEYLTTTAKNLHVFRLLVEALVHTEGFRGACEGLSALQSILQVFWDAGLEPTAPEDRVAALRWLNRLGESLHAISITKCLDGRRNFSFKDQVEAEITGSRTAKGLTKAQELVRTRRLAEGKPSIEDWQNAVASTDPASLRAVRLDILLIQRTYQRISKFLKSHVETTPGKPPVGLDGAGPDIDKLRKLVSGIVPKRVRPRISANHPVDETSPAPRALELSESRVDQLPATGTPEPGLSEGSMNEDGWQSALLGAMKDFPAGLALVSRLADAEPSGRVRFYRKLAVAELYLAKGYNDPALIVLEELTKQIEENKLVGWESTSVISRVWADLCVCRRLCGKAPEAEQLFQQLCKLAPWHALEAMKDRK